MQSVYFSSIYGNDIVTFKQMQLHEIAHKMYAHNGLHLEIGSLHAKFEPKLKI